MQESFPASGLQAHAAAVMASQPLSPGHLASVILICSLTMHMVKVVFTCPLKNASLVWGKDWLMGLSQGRQSFSEAK